MSTAVEERFWKTRAFWEDYLERIVATFIAALIAGVPTAAIADADWQNAFVFAGITTALTALKGLLAALNDPSSGASLGTAIPREAVRSRRDITSPTDAVAEEGSDLPPDTPVKPEEPYTER